MKSDNRFQWALKILQIRPEDKVLEIGCGTGVAARMIAQLLQSGRMTAIDQSAIMVSKAKAMAMSDKVQFLTGRLGRGRMKLPQRHFSKAFAFNVGSFWQAEGARELEALRSYLKPTGTFYLFHQPPSSHKTMAIAEKSKTLLEAAGYKVEDVYFEDIEPATISCIVAKPSSLKKLQRK